MKDPKLRFLLRALLSIGLIAWLLSRLDWHEVGGLLHGISPAPLLAGLTLGVTGQLLMAERTRLTLLHWGVRLSHSGAYAVTWIGQFCNNFLPGGMGGDMVKFYRVCRLHPHGKASVLVALVADRIMALAALVCLSVAALACGDRGMLRQLLSGVAFGSRHDGFPAWGFALVALAGIGIFVVLLLWRFREAIIERGAAHLQTVRAALAQGKRLDSRIAVAFLLALLVHSLGIAAACFCARSLAIPLGLSQAFLMWPVVIVAMMMPISVNGHGLREFILLYYFERWHLTSHLGQGAGTREAVVAFSLLVVVCDLVCNLPGGLLLLGTGPSAANAAGSKPQTASLAEHP